jgi:hypothetical protein
MGYRIENYSLTELHKIAVPGHVAPALFWALPVGDWRPRDLDKVWRWFTGHSGGSNHFGLLLVKDLAGGKIEQTNVNLASVGAKLSDLMPAGAERFARTSAYREPAPRMLVLSGGYPQPGWGVLVQWQSVRQFENLIRRTVSGLHDSNSATKLRLFSEAAQKFHSLHNLCARPGRSMLTAY